MSRPILLIIPLFSIVIFEACSSGVDHLPTKNFSDATVYFRKFDSSTPAALDDTTLKEAYDVSYVLNRKVDIDQLYSFLTRMKCNSAPEVVDDLRVLVEFRSNSGSYLRWRSSFFNYVDFQGNVCHLHNSERENIQNLLFSLGRKNPN
jgi:hypothetical protein